MTSEIGQYVIVVGGPSQFKIMKIQPGRFRVNKQWMQMEALAGLTLGMTYTSDKDGNISVYIENAQQDVEIQADNRQLYDTKNAQNLTEEEVIKMQNDLSGSELVEKLCENSETFDSKTEFSQQKYIKSKKRKHMVLFRLDKATMANLSNSWFTLSPKGSLRADVMSNILCLGNIGHDSRVLVYDEYQGQVYGAIRQRTAGAFLYPFEEDVKEYRRYKFYNIGSPISIVDFEQQSEFDSIILAYKERQKDEILPHLNYLRTGGQIVVHSQSIAYLVSLAEHLVQDYVDLRIEEIFTREYQVLPQRTHPTMNGCGYGGFLLSATKISNS